MKLSNSVINVLNMFFSDGNFLCGVERLQQAATSSRQTKVTDSSLLQCVFSFNFPPKTSRSYGVKSSKFFVLFSIPSYHSLFIFYTFLSSFFYHLPIISPYIPISICLLFCYYFSIHSLHSLLIVHTLLFHACQSLCVYRY